MDKLPNDDLQKQSINECQVCKTSNYASIIMDFKSYTVAKCDRCGFVYVNGKRQLSVEHEKYQKDQFEQGYLQYYDAEQIASEQFNSCKFILQYSGTNLKKLLNSNPILDIGCARGHFLNLLSNYTSRENLTGCDISESMIEWGKKNFGLNLYATPIENAPFPASYFGLIIMFDILEHVPFPRNVLEKVMELISSGGWVIVEVPSEITIFRILAKLAYKFTMGIIKSPAQRIYHTGHLSYFTPSSLRTLLMDIGAENVTIISKETHITRFGSSRFHFPIRVVIRILSLCDKILGTQAKLLCAFQKK